MISIDDLNQIYKLRHENEMIGKVLSNHQPCPELPLDSLLDTAAIIDVYDDRRALTSYAVL